MLFREKRKRPKANIVKTWTPSQPPEGFNCIARDAQGNLWVGTTEGVLILDPNYQLSRFSVLDTILSAEETVYSLFWDNQGTLWIGTMERGLIKWTDSSPQFFTVNGGYLPDDCIYDITQDANGAMWFATSAGLVVYDGRWTTLTTANSGLLANEFFCVRADTSKKGVWAGSADGGLYFLQGNTVYGFFHGEVVGREKKLYVNVETSTVRNFLSGFTPHPMNQVYAVCPYEKGIFFGSNARPAGGLYLWRSRKSSQITGVAQDIRVCSNILQMGGDNIAMGIDEGVIVFNTRDPGHQYPLQINAAVTALGMDSQNRLVVGVKATGILVLELSFA